jgi:hypothetical protein
MQVLDKLEEGATMRIRKESAGRSSTGMGRSAQVACLVEGAHAKLVFEGQGLTSLLRHANLTGTHNLEAAPKAIIELVEIMEGPWHRRKSIEVKTSGGTISLVPQDAETYATWVLGLNTAMTAVELHKGDGIHPLRPARKLPLSKNVKTFGLNPEASVSE